MIKNYLKIAIRNILRNKVFSFINIAGIAVAIAVAGLIMLYVQYEWGYDRFYPNTNRIYLVYCKDPGNFFIGSDLYAVTPEPLGTAMKNEFPDIENYVTLGRWNKALVKVANRKVFEENILCATAPDLFKMFSYNFTAGNPETALSQPNTVVLSENVAHRFFGAEEPIGKTVEINIYGKTQVWTVTGVFRAMPNNSQFSSYGIVTSFDTYASTIADRKDSFQWGNNSWFTYLLLRKGTNVETLQAKFPLFVQKNIPASVEEGEEFFLQQIADTHLFSKANFGFGVAGNLSLVSVLSAIAIVILAIASINYMNLATARGSVRAREVGVRKVIGAKRSQLIAQFMGESMMLALTAGVIGLVLVEILLRLFSRLVGVDFGSGSLSHPSFVVGFLVVILIVGLLSGAYPALVLSMYRPAAVVKGSAKSGKRSSLRNVLVTAQFAASIALISCTIIILSQLNYIQTKNMGYNRQNIIVVPINLEKSIFQHVGMFEEKLREHSFVSSVTACSFLPIDIESNTEVHATGRTGSKNAQAYCIYGGYAFLKTFEIQIVEGRDFSSLVATDSSSGIIINQTLQKALGRDGTVGRMVNINGQRFRVVGVMKDFNLHSVRHKIQPLFYAMGGWRQYLCVRVQPGHIGPTISLIKTLWNRFGAQRPFTHTLMNDDFKKMYGNEERLSQAVSFSSGLAILIACMGLFGLITFSIERRRKEIGIRKVLGATVAEVVSLLSSEFLLVVMVANLIAWPVAFFLMRDWLNGFAYRTPLGLVPFIVAAITTLGIAGAAVGFHAVKAAMANPVESLRYE